MVDACFRLVAGVRHRDGHVGHMRIVSDAIAFAADATVTDRSADNVVD